MNPQLIAQATDSVLVTDSSTRWQELISAQHRAQRVVTYPWNNANSQFNVLPIDELFLDTFKKSQGDFGNFRDNSAIIMYQVDKTTFRISDKL
ncbi:MAG: hypothetical protein QMA97_00860 [Glaciecola sp.]